MDILEFILRLTLSTLLGASIGVERQSKQKSAGLRTNTLVSLGAASYVLLSASLTGETGDPSRIAAQIVTGIGFLGAGVIMKDGLNVQGLNTAATIWCSAAVGSLAGVGLYIEASIVAFFVILVHVLFRPLGHRINSSSIAKESDSVAFYTISINCKVFVENHIRALVLDYLKSDQLLQLRSLKSLEDDEGSNATIIAEILSVKQHDIIIEKIAGRISVEYGVTEVSWTFNADKNE